MNYYEQMKAELMTALSESFECQQLNSIAHVLDFVIARYDVQLKETGMTVYLNELPKAAKIYLVCKKMAGCSEGTLENYQIMLTSFFKTIGKQPEEVTANDIRMWLYWYQEERKISLRTLDKYREYISRFFGWAHGEGYIQANPAKNVESIRYEEKPREALTQVELEYLRLACKTKRERAIVEVLYSTGCRVSELANLKITDIDWREKTVRLFGKGKKHRVSFLNAKAEVALLAYLDTRTDQNNSLFVSVRKPYGSLSKDAIEKVMRTLAQRISDKTQKKITPHVLRHTTATNALSSGMPIESISLLLGHENIETTMIYAHTSLDSVREGHRKYVI